MSFYGLKANYKVGRNDFVFYDKFQELFLFRKVEKGFNLFRIFTNKGLIKGNKGFSACAEWFIVYL